MANFPYLPNRGSLAAWATGSLVTSNEFWFFESSIVKCPNFADGGTYAPSASVIVGGAGMKLTGPTWCTGSVKLDGNVDIGLGSGQNLAVLSTTTFGAPVAFGSTVSFSGVSTFTNTILAAAVQVTTYIDVTGQAAFINNVVIGDDPTTYCWINSTIRAPLTFGTNGYIKRRWLRPTVNPGLDKNASVVDYDQVFMAVASDLVLEDAGDDGAIIHVTNETLGTISIKNTSGTVLTTLGAGSVVGFMRHANAPGPSANRWRVVS